MVCGSFTCTEIWIYCTTHFLSTLTTKGGGGQSSPPLSAVLRLPSLIAFASADKRTRLMPSISSLPQNAHKSLVVSYAAKQPPPKKKKETVEYRDELNLTAISTLSSLRLLLLFVCFPLVSPVSTAHKTLSTALLNFAFDLFVHDTFVLDDAGLSSHFVRCCGPCSRLDCRLRREQLWHQPLLQLPRQLLHVV
jgi:hypothetical protein